jgi:hypothetical protein
MASITTRQTSGSGATVKNLPLTNAEIDVNFLNLNQFKVEITDAVSSNTANAVIRRDGSGGFSAGDVALGNVTSGGNGTFTGDVAVNGGDLTTNQTTFNLLSSPTTLNIGANGNNISIGASSGTLTLNNPTILAVNTSFTFKSLGVGTAASGTTGEIRATGNISSNYSDERLKENIEIIPNALEKVCELRGVTFTANKLAESFGYTSKEVQVGVLAGDVQKVLPEIVKPAPFDIMLFEDKEISRSGESYKTVQYEKIVPLLIEAIKQLNKEVQELKGIK